MSSLERLEYRSRQEMVLRQIETNYTKYRSVTMNWTYNQLNVVHVPIDNCECYLQGDWPVVVYPCFEPMFEPMTYDFTELIKELENVTE